MYSKLKKVVFLVFLFFTLAAAVKGEIISLTVDINIPEQYTKILPGNEILVENEIIFVGKEDSKKIDIIIECAIIGEDGTVINKITDTKGGQLRVTDIKHLLIPENTAPQVGIIKTTATYKGLIGMETANFEIIEIDEDYLKTTSEQASKEQKIYMIAILSFILTLFFITVYLQHRRFKQLEKRVTKRLEKGTGHIKFILFCEILLIELFFLVCYLRVF